MCSSMRHVTYSKSIKPYKLLLSVKIWTQRFEPNLEYRVSWWYFQTIYLMTINVCRRWTAHIQKLLTFIANLYFYFLDWSWFDLIWSIIHLLMSNWVNFSISKKKLYHIGDEVVILNPKYDVTNLYKIRNSNHENFTMEIGEYPPKKRATRICSANTS